MSDLEPRVTKLEIEQARHDERLGAIERCVADFKEFAQSAANQANSSMRRWALGIMGVVISGVLVHGILSNLSGG